METKIEAKAREQGADELLKCLYARLGSGLKVLLTCMDTAQRMSAMPMHVSRIFTPLPRLAYRLFSASSAPCSLAFASIFVSILTPKCIHELRFLIKSFIG